MFQALTIEDPMDPFAKEMQRLAARIYAAFRAKCPYASGWKALYGIERMRERSRRVRDALVKVLRPMVIQGNHGGSIVLDRYAKSVPLQTAAEYIANATLSKIPNAPSIEFTPDEHYCLVIRVYDVVWKFLSDARNDGGRMASLAQTQKRDTVSKYQKTEL